MTALDWKSNNGQTWRHFDAISIQPVTASTAHFRRGVWYWIIKSCAEFGDDISALLRAVTRYEKRYFDPQRGAG